GRADKAGEADAGEAGAAKIKMGATVAVDPCLYIPKPESTIAGGHSVAPRSDGVASPDSPSSAAGRGGGSHRRARFFLLGNGLIPRLRALCWCAGGFAIDAERRPVLGDDFEHAGLEAAVARRADRAHGIISFE